MANPYEQFRQPDAAVAAPAPSAAPVTDAGSGADAPGPAATASGDGPLSPTDILRGVVGGMRDGVQGLVDTGIMGMQKVSEGVDAVTGGNPEVTKAAYKEVKSHLTFSEVEQNDTTLGHITRSLVSFGIGFGAAGKALKVVPAVGSALASLGEAGRAGKAGVGLIQGLAGGFVATDPHAQGISNLIQSVPALQNPITEALAADPKSSDWANKLRGGIENGIIGAMVEPLIGAVGAMRKANALRAAGKEAEATKVMAEESPKIEEAFRAAQEQPVQVENFPEVSSAPKVAEAGVNDVYHGTDSAFNKVDMKDGFWVSKDPEVAGKYASPDAPHRFMGESGNEAYNVRPYTLDPNAKIITKEEAYGLIGHGNSQAEMAAKLSAQGVDGIKIDRGNGPEYFMFNPKSLKEKFTGEVAGETVAAQAAQDATIRMTPEDRALYRQGIQLHGVGTDSNLKLGLRDGVVNFNKINTTEDVKNVISDLASVAKEEMGNIAGTHMTLDQVQDIADWVGKDATALYTSLKTTADQVGAGGDATKELAAQVIAGKTIIITTANKIAGIAERIDSGIATEMDQVGFAHLTDILASVLDHVSGIQTAAARATAAGRIRITGGINSANFADLLEKVGGSDAVKALAKRVRMAGGDITGITGAVKAAPTLLDKLASVGNYYWVNSVLSGLKTSLTIISSNAMNSVLMPGYRIVGGVAQMIPGLGGASKAGGMEEITKGIYQWEAMKDEFRNSLVWAGKAWKANGSLIDPFGTPMEKAAQAAGSRNPMSSGYLSATDKDSGVLNKIFSQYADANWIDKAGQIIGAPGRFINTEHEFFKQLVYRSHIVADAKVEGLKMGLGEENGMLNAYIAQKLQSSVNEAGAALDKGALAAGRMGTFTQKLSDMSTNFGWRSMGEGIATLSSSHPIFKAILPFVKVPTNLFRQTMDMTAPVALMKAQVRADIAAGGEAGAVALGKIGVGTAMWGTAIGMAYSGRITGGGPKDPVLLKEMGPDWKPYSFVINNADGTKTYQSFARIDPFGSFFGLAGDYAEIHGKMGSHDQMDAAETMAFGLMKNMASKTYLRGLVDTMEAFTGDDKGFHKWVKSRAASYAPGILQVLNPDDDLKDVRTVMDAFISRIPGWSTTVEAKRDNFGDKVSPPMGYPWQAINPFINFRSTSDPVRHTLAQLAMSDSEARFPMPSPLIGDKSNGIDMRDYKNAKGQTAYDRWMELHQTYQLRGQTLHESMQDMMETPTFQSALEAVGKGDPTYRGSLAADLVKKQFTMYERATKMQLYDEFPGLGQAAQQFTLGKKTTKVEGSNTATPIDQLKAIAGQN